MGTWEDLSSPIEPPPPPSLDLGLTSSTTEERLTAHEEVDPFSDDPLAQTLVHDLGSLNLGTETHFHGAGELEEGGGHGDQYPLRPYAEDCTFYVKTGRCKFGAGCKFNHPLTRALEGDERSNLLEQSKWIECKYYLTGEGCKYGNACRYSHSKENLESSLPQRREMNGERTMARTEQVVCKFYQTPRGCMYGDSCKFAHTTEHIEQAELNFLDLPIRPQEKDCPFYMRSGSCKYGVGCKFHHPDPASAKQSGSFGFSSGSALATDASWSNVNGGYTASHSNGSIQDRPSWSSEMNFKKVDTNYNSHSSFASGAASSVHVHMELKPQWSLYQAPPYPQLRDGSISSSSLGNNQVRTEMRNYSDQMQSEEFPERPGEQVCGHYIMTGDCKYKSSCRYHHPKDRTSKEPYIPLSSKGLPLRPGKSICRHYEQYGICKYGSSCLFDHPESPFSSFHTDLLPGHVPVSNAAGCLFSKE